MALLESISVAILNVPFYGNIQFEGHGLLKFTDYRVDSMQI